MAEAGMERCLVLGGDRDNPAGELNSSLQILETGLIQKRGVKTIRIGSYPEGHPKIPEAVLDKARADKLAIAERDGLDVTIVSQFVFEAEPIVGFAKKLRAEGTKAPFRVGVAGPADRALLMKYALICGIGNSLRVLKGRAGLALSTLTAKPGGRGPRRRRSPGGRSRPRHVRHPFLHLRQPGEVGPMGQKLRSLSRHSLLNASSRRSRVT
ncbi:MAG: hypothetical protein WDN45_19315 [Caulobacteraceae bacterium]